MQRLEFEVAPGGEFQENFMDVHVNYSGCLTD